MLYDGRNHTETNLPLLYRTECLLIPVVDHRAQLLGFVLFTEWGMSGNESGDERAIMNSKQELPGNKRVGQQLMLLHSLTDQEEQILQTLGDLLDCSTYPNS